MSENEGRAADTQGLRNLREIEHIVVVMFENRSFDSLLGWLYETPAKEPLRFFPAGSPPRFDGLRENTYFNRFPASFGDEREYPVQRGTSSFTVPDPDPHEPFQNVYRQLWGPDVRPPDQGEQVTTDPSKTPPMSGFLADYASAVGYDGRDARKKQAALRILETYTPEQVPVLSELARWYAVSDAWFASIPTQTNCNRAFAATGTSQGLVNNHWIKLAKGAPVAWNLPTVWDVLMQHSDLELEDWRIYYSELWFSWFGEYCFTVDMLEKLWPVRTSVQKKMHQFHQDARNGSLPALSFLEPMWYLAGLSDGPPSSYHPPADVRPAESFLKEVFDSLTSTPQAREKWRNTLLVVTFDEHGGCYDHVPPPVAVAPGDLGKPPAAPDYTFDFKRLGVRVPTLLVSPRIEKHTVFRSESSPHHYDHCSVIATLLKWKGIDPSRAGMGGRVANAPTFENVLGLSETDARTDLPNLTPVSALPPPYVPRGVAWTEDDRGQLWRLLHFASAGRYSASRLRSVYEQAITHESREGLLEMLHAFFGPPPAEAARAGRRGCLPLPFLRGRR